MKRRGCMKVTKRHGTRIFLVAEVIIFGSFYFLSSNGLRALFHLKTDIYQLTQEVDTLKTEIAHLNTMVDLQKKHPFFQEKIAREQLQMAQANDEIYLIE
jgi:cell division protein FtsB